jgi:hypothetical protein
MLDHADLALCSRDNLQKVVPGMEDFVWERWNVIV